MTARRPKDIGTDAERAVVRYLAGNGWPHAERRALRGVKDAGDITGTPGLCWSVKGGAYAHHPSDHQIDTWLDELDQQRAHAGGDHGILITRRHRVGDPGRWWAWIRVDSLATLTGSERWWPGRLWAVTHLGQAVEILRQAGYGSE